MKDTILENLYIIHYVLKNTLFYNRENYEDYYQIGIIGLLNAVKNYNEDKNVKFSTYAYTCIKNEILKSILKESIKSISLQESIGEGITVEDVIVDDSVNVHDTVFQNQLKNELYLAINSLDYIERIVISLYYGIGNDIYKQNEISQILHIPQYQISRIKRRALKHLKEKLFIKYY